MSETKLPDIVERDRRVLPGWLRSLYEALTDDGCLLHLEKLKAAADEIERLRSHAGWHEAIDPEALEAARRIVGGHVRSTHPLDNYFEGDDAIKVARALLPPGGEKG